MPGRKAPKTWDQIEAMRQKAIRFLRDVVQDEEKAQEFEGLSTREYAERKGVQVAENPSCQTKTIERTYRQMAKRRAEPTRAELEDRVAELEEQVEDLEGELEEVEGERDELSEQVDAACEALGVEVEEEEPEDTDQD